MEQTATLCPATVLFGLESSGKSALFRALTDAVSDESNFRGSTVVCRKCRSAICQCDMIDTPGIRLQEDAVTSHLATEAMRDGDRVVLVVRGTHLMRELTALLETTELSNKRAALVVTFADKAHRNLEAAVKPFADRLGIPAAVLNARRPDARALQHTSEVIAAAAPLREDWNFEGIRALPARDPTSGLYERPLAGPLTALGTVAALFAGPVYLAYLLAATLEDPLEAWLMMPIVSWMEPLPPLLFSILGGTYGVLTLGWFSFLWAFPVVLFIGISTALAEETGVKDRVTAALDPLLRHIGLSGRDLIPVLSGFGCNVVAVFQSRACSLCTRKSCVSLIAYGSACSYQIGASLSIFSVAGHPWLFAPYLLVLFIVGAVHTRLWHGKLAEREARPLNERAFLQRPSLRAVRWRVASVVRMFLWQAMPIFLGVCVVAALLEWAGLLHHLSAWTGPLLNSIDLPAAVAPALLFSVLRKDGLLILNEGEGALLATLGVGQVFILVYLASTLTACLVTLWTIRRELGASTAARLAGRQALTAVASTLLLVFLLRAIGGSL